MRRPNTSASTVALRWRPQLQSQSNAPDQARARSPSPLRREASVGSFRLSSTSSYGKYEALPQRLIEFASRGGGDTPKQPDLTLGLHMAPLYVGTPASEHPHEPRPARKSLTRGFMTGMPSVGRTKDGGRPVDVVWQRAVTSPAGAPPAAPPSPSTTPSAMASTTRAGLNKSATARGGLPWRER